MTEWAREIPVEAVKVAEKFWPGPLTLVLKRDHRVLDLVTGGQETVGVRVPNHPVALALLKEFGDGVAAPSANRFGRVSPTTADHVRCDLGSEADVILDGGSCSIGVESTIIDFSTERPVILRPGGVTREEVESFLKRKIQVGSATGVRTAGQLESHYAPRAEVLLAGPLERDALAEKLRTLGKKVSILGQAEISAHDLYASLRRADEEGFDVVVVPLPGEEGLGWAVADRLRKAAGRR
jgi:L-threonylcarbamoyladenylate synthase